MIKICDYGCGQESKYQLKNGKWCCSEYYSQCPEIRRKNSDSKKGRSYEEVYGKKTALKMKQKRRELKEGVPQSEETKRKISKMNKGMGKLIIKQIIKQYPLFSQIEEMRYNPDKPGQKEIQVHCKNHLCKNSKEKDGWFTPNGNQLYHRANAIENPKGFGESNFYCSEKCKEDCPLYNLKGDPLKETELPYTQVEKDIFNKEVLERQRKEDGYNFCEKCFSTKDLHVHHENPVKTHPHLALDPDNGIVLCGKCHYKYGHKTGSECSTGNLASKILLNCRLGGQK